MHVLSTIRRAFVIGVVLMQPSFAQNVTGQTGVPLSAQAVPAAVAALAKKMATPSQGPAMQTTVFATPAVGVYGIAVERDKHVQVFYTDRAAKTFVAGMMFDAATKEDVGTRFIKSHMPGRVDLAEAMRGKSEGGAAVDSGDRVATEVELQAVAKAEGFTTTTTSSGDQSKTIFALIDPNCGFCAQAWFAMATMKNSALKGYKIRWIPMTLGGDDAQVATMLGEDRGRFEATNVAMAGAKNGAAVVGENLNGESPAIQRAKANRELVQRLGITATPTFFVEASTGGRFVRREGFSTITALLSAAPTINAKRQ